MRLKGIVEEDFTNYKYPSMFLNTCFCDFKCCTELGIDVGACQNAPLAQSKIIDIPDQVIFDHFRNNPITKVVVVGGMEPFLQMDELESLIKLFRENYDDSLFVIYTGYYPEEIKDSLDRIKQYKSIVVKFGRFVPDKPGIFDPILGINLASDNQYAMVIS